MKAFQYIAAILLFLPALPGFALDGTEVMQKVLHAFYYQGNDLRAQAHMRIIDQQGRERIREFTLLRLNLEGEKSNIGKQKYYVFFTQPADVKKMVFMAWKNVEKDDDRWLYLPALDLVKRIAASDERASFVGSHFFYEDVSGRGLDEDTHKLIGSSDQHYIVESKPKQPGKVEFTRYKVWVDKTSYLPMKIEYYNKELVYRRYQTLQTKVIDGYATVTQAKMEDKRNDGKTLIDYSSIKYSQDLPKKVFSERYLRKAPKKYLK